MEIPRAPLEPAAVAAAVATAGGGWQVRFHAEAPSTNALAAAEPVAPAVVVADHQTAGRGRLDRTWQSPPGTSLTFSAVVDPGLPDAEWPLLPLASAVAVAEGIAAVTGLDPVLKWPNDVLLGPRGGKVAGILLERVAAARPLAIIGIGINVAMAAEELPVPTATSLAIEGAAVDRAAVLGAVLAALRAQLALLRSDRRALLAAYRGACGTVGREVRVELPDGAVLEGLAESVDDHGRLVVGGAAVGAGDVVHAR